MGKKAESLIRLASLGFNTPDFELLTSPDEISNHRKQFEGWGKVSLRVDAVDPRLFSFNMSFYPNQIWGEECEYLLRGLLSDPDRMVIVQRAIDPKKTWVAGKMVATEDEELIEYFVGPGTIRDMETGQVSTHIQYFNKFGRLPEKSTPLAILGVMDVIYNLRKSCISAFKRPFFVEWSLYQDKVGKKNRNLILWEQGNL